MDITLVMRKFRKSIAGFTILALIASFAFSGLAFAYTDDGDISSWADDYVTQAADDGWMTGNDDGSFNPQGTITRQELAKVLVLAFLGEDYVDEDYDAGYTDADDVSDWALAYVNTANEFGIMTGTGDGTQFSPLEEVNRATMAQALVNAAVLTEDTSYGPTFDDVDEDAWYYGAVETAYLYQLLDGYGDGSFGPSNPATREAVAKMTVGALSPEMRDMTDNDSDSDATLEIEVSDDTPEAGTLPKYATSVPVASWDFTAEGGDVELDDLTVHQYAISSLSTVTLYLYDGAERLTSGKSVGSSDYEAEFNNLNIEIDEGDTVTLTVRADLGATASTGEMGLEIVDEGSLDVGASDVDGDFPLQGEKFSLATEAVGNLTIETNGSVSNPQVGEDGVTVAKFKISSDSTTTSFSEDALLTEIGLYLTGTISTDDVEDLELYVSGEDDAIATADGVDSNDVVRFEIEDGYQIDKGSSKTFTVKADLNTGRTDDTIKFYVDEDTDLVAIGGSREYGMHVTRTSYDGGVCTAASGDTDECSVSTLEGGDITISSSGPSAGDIAVNGKDVELLNFTIVANSEVTFKKFPVSLTASEVGTDQGLYNNTDSAANFTDIKVMNVDDGDEFMSSLDVTSFVTTISGSTVIGESTDTSARYHIFTDEFTMEAGEELNLSLTADVYNDSDLSGMTIYAELPLGDSASYPEIRDVNNKTLTNSSVLVPASTITGKTMTVKDSSLTLSLASTPVAGSSVYVKGTTDVEFVGMIFACGDASGCYVTDMNLYSAIDEDGDGTGSFTEGKDGSTNVNAVVGQVKLVDGDGEDLTDYASVQGTTGLIEFEDINWQMEAGETETVYVVGDVKSSMYGDDVAFYVKAATDITVEDDDGSTFSATGTPNGGASSVSAYATVKDGGRLTISVASDTADEDIVVSGATGVEVAKFKFETTKASGGASEAFVVDDLSITNWQEGVLAADYAEYDNNVDRIKLVYTDSEGTEQSVYGDLSSGVATFSDLDFYIEKDGYAYLTAYADLNTIASSDATAGEKVNFSISLEDFSAMSGSGGEEYDATRLDATYVTALSDISLGTVTFTDADETFDLDGAQDKSSVTLGTSTTLTIDDNGDTDNTNRLPVGSLLCVDDDNSGACSSEDKYVVTSWPQTTGDTEDTVTVTMVDDAGDGNYDDDDPLMYSMPGTGYLTDTNAMYVYENKPTLSLNVDSLSGSSALSGTDEIFTFDVTADSSGDEIQFRTGSGEIAAAAGDDQNGTNNAAPTTSGTNVAGGNLEGTSGTGYLVALTNYEAGDTISFDLGASYGDYSGVGLWMKWDDAAPSADPDWDDLKYDFAAAADTASGVGGTGFSATVCGSTDSAMDDGIWYYCEIAGTPDARYFNVEFDALDKMLVGDTVTFDNVMAFKEKITVDISSTALDAYSANSTNAGGPVEAYLTYNGNTYATGYAATDNGADDSTTARITFVPSSELIIDSGSTKALTVQTDTIDLIKESAGDDIVSVSMDYGTSSTNGDLWWYETNATVKWVGDVSSTKLSGDSIIY